MARQTVIKTEARGGKYGLVVVTNADGTFNREFKITGAELATLRASVNGVPRGVTRLEWETGRAIVAGKDFDVGDAKLLTRGSVLFKHDEQIIGGQIVEWYVMLRPGDWTGTLPNITVTPAVIATALAWPWIHPGRPIPVVRNLLSITNGIADLPDIPVLPEKP